jgi:hypothetical protein
MPPAIRSPLDQNALRAASVSRRSPRSRRRIRTHRQTGIYSAQTPDPCACRTAPISSDVGDNCSSRPRVGNRPALRTEAGTAGSLAVTRSAASTGAEGGCGSNGVTSNVPNLLAIPGKRLDADPRLYECTGRREGMAAAERPLVPNETRPVPQLGPTPSGLDRPQTRNFQGIRQLRCRRRKVTPLEPHPLKAAVGRGSAASPSDLRTRPEAATSRFRAGAAAWE